MKLMNMARRNIFRNRRRSILSASAIAVAVVTMVFLFAFIGGIKLDMATQIQDWVSGEVRIQHKDYEKNESFFPLYLGMADTEALVRTIEARPDVASVVPRIAFPGVWYKDDEQKPLLGWALDLEREEAWNRFGRFVSEGRMPAQGEREVLLGSGFAAANKLTPGDEFSVQYFTAGFSSNYINLRVAGLVSTPMAAMNNRLFVVDRSVLAAKLFMDDKATQILVKSRTGDAATLAEALRTDLAQVLPADTLQSLDIRTWEEVPGLYSFMGLGEMIYDMIGVFFYLLASTVIITTTMMVVFERVREIGTLSAMGMTGSEILRLFFLESFQIALAGTLTGMALGSIAVLWLGATGLDMRALMSQVDMGISGMIYPQFTLRSLVVVPMSALAVASLSALIPARRALRIQPVEALRTYS